MGNNQYDIVVIGGGPAGLLAAGRAAMDGAKVLLLEKMEKPARKLRITGKGRCNVTNLKPLDEFLEEIKPQPLFLRDAFAEFFSEDIITLLENQGVDLSVERGQRVFPTNGKAWDVAEALIRWATKQGVTIKNHAPVKKINYKDDKVISIDLEDQKEQTINCKNVILATGGKSYPRTGSTGDGYTLAKNCGHIITPLYPTLVGLETQPAYKRFNLLKLKNISLTLMVDGRKVQSQLGEVELMPYGISGALVVSMSRDVVPLLDEGKKVELILDLKPALDHQKIDNRLLREIDANPRMSMMDLARKLLPKPLAQLMLEELKIVPSKGVARASAQERKYIRLWLKEKRFAVTGFRSWSEAIATAGGVSLSQINPHTMESKLVKGLYFAGEVMDLDGATGGYNLQIAYSTGWLAGKSAASKVTEQKNRA